MDKAVIINLGVIATALEARYRLVNFLVFFLSFFLIIFLNLLCGTDNAVIIEVGAAVQARIGAVYQQLGRPTAATGTPGMDGDVIRAWITIVAIIGIADFVIFLKVLGQFTCILVIIIVLPHFLIVRHRGGYNNLVMNILYHFGRVTSLTR